MLRGRVRDFLKRSDNRFGFRATRHVVDVDMREANDTLRIDDICRRNRELVGLLSVAERDVVFKDVL